MSWLAYETCKTCERQIYDGSFSNTAEWLEFQIYDTAPHIRRRVRPSHTSDSRVGPVDAQEPDAFYGGPRSPVRQLSSPQSLIKYLMGGFVRDRRCLAQESAYICANAFEYVLLFSIVNQMFLGYFCPKKLFQIIKIDNFQGELTNISAKNEALVALYSPPRAVDASVLPNMSSGALACRWYAVVRF